MTGFWGRVTVLAGTFLAGAAMVSPSARAAERCTVNADLAFSRQISMRTTTGDIAVTDATTTCGGVERTVTGYGYFGKPQPPLQAALGAAPDTCFSGIDYLYLYAAGRRSRHSRIAPLWIDLTLDRQNTTDSATGDATLGTAQSNLSGAGDFVPSTTTSCLISGWSGGSVGLSLTDG